MSMSVLTDLYCNDNENDDDVYFLFFLAQKGVIFYLEGLTH